jgi:hypothetical protein
MPGILHCEQEVRLPCHGDPQPQRLELMGALAEALEILDRNGQESLP